MAELEKVIKGLEYCANSCGNGCPYADIDDDCQGVLCKDALELLKEQKAMMQCVKEKCCICPYCANCDVDDNGLLKEQEAETVESIQIDRSDKWGADLTGYCPSCKRPLKSRFNKRFCGECGKKVKWE